MAEFAFAYPGDVRADGFTYIRTYTNRNGTRCQTWLSQSAIERAKLSITRAAARVRANKEGVPYNLTTVLQEVLTHPDGIL